MAKYLSFYTNLHNHTMVRIIMTKLLQEIQTYWTNRAEGYSQVNQGELHSEQNINGNKLYYNIFLLKLIKI